MRYFSLLVFALLTVGSALAHSQGAPAPLSRPMFEDERSFAVSVNYNYVLARRVPVCCFSMNGLDGSLEMNLTRHFSVLADAAYASTSDTGNGDHLILRTYLAGPRFRFSMGRFTPSLQALAGGATSSSRFFPINNGSSWATSLGGGMDMRISSRFDWRAARVEYLLTHLPNATNDYQNILRVSTGLVFHFGRAR